MRLVAARGVEHIGRSAGSLYAISTAGSIAGTLLTAFWLIPLLGLDPLVIGITVVLFFSSALATTELPSAPHGPWWRGERGEWDVVVQAILFVFIAFGQRNLTALPYPRDDARLVEKGPYAIIRNPIPSGLILGALGWGLWLQSLPTLGFAAALFALFDLQSRKEQARLTERFPEYADYAARAKRLVPWVY